ncbi:exported hypothetical protein [Paraburkholderia piptadeniae]|uniref:Alpha/beta hydrolase n=1 Tax=Paraburkholderia piptadeniae TaxID=1701573 RepID=A0A1N7S1B8_9BURK|nr:hypothetical protein [Paraburkholderia piptadeniae]SIT40767.1 exported hypothetical protein [Paraburkholderia piptadeniae]
MGVSTVGKAWLMVSLMTGAAHAFAWNLPADKSTVPEKEVEEILAGRDFPETSGFTKRLEYVDYKSNGVTFTQVVMRLDPDKPLLHDGRKVVLAATEEGSSSANGFIVTDEGKEGIGVWLAKRGVTFIALNRIGRWNFLAPDRTGSWESIPLNERMPIFSQHQTSYWSKDDFTMQPAGKTSSSSGSEYVRFPKPGTELYKEIVAATPVAMVDGLEAGLRKVLPDSERKHALLLYWGFSTGGALMWPLAERIRPDGYLNWGSSPPGVAYYYGSTVGGRWDWPYEKSALRVRGRGRADFEFYNTHADPQDKDARWQRDLREPRFKAVEDAVMFYNAGSLAEDAMRLYSADFLPAEQKKAGFNKILTDIMATSMPGPALHGLPVWDMNGTLDEVYSPQAMEAARVMMQPYVGKHVLIRVEGLNHSIVNRQVRVIGPIWLRAIENGYFDS